MLCQEVFYVLKTTPHLHIFTKVATRAIIEEVWHKCAANFYCAHVAYRSAEIAVLLWWVLMPPQGLYMHLTWSFLFATGCRELCYELFEINGLFQMMRGGELGDRHPFVRFVLNWVTLGNMFDFLSILLLLGLVVMMWGTADEVALHNNKELLAAVVLTRWMQLMVACRAFSAVGQKLLPIFQSTASMGGIFCVTAFTFSAFLHAFWALGAEGMTNDEIFVNTIRFLLVGDGDGIDMVLALGGATEGQLSVVPVMILVCALFLFCIWIMNLFIAGTDQAYEQALEFAETRFLQERASICLQCLFRPSLPWSWRRDFPVFGLRLIQVLLVVPAWLFLLTIEWLPLWIPSAMLSFAIVVTEALMMQPPWHEAERWKHYEAKRRKAAAAGSPSGSLTSNSPRPGSVGSATGVAVALDEQPNGQHLQLPPQCVVSQQLTVPGTVAEQKQRLLAADPCPANGFDYGGNAAGEAQLLSPSAHPSALAVPLPRFVPVPTTPLPPPQPPPMSERPQPPQQPPPQIALQVARVASDASSTTRSRSQSREEVHLPGMFLWVCHRDDYDELDFWPAEESSDTSMRLEGRVSGLKRDSMLRSRKTSMEISGLRRRAEALHGFVQQEMKTVHGEISRVERRVEDRLSCIEDLLLRLAAGIGGIGVGAEGGAGMWRRSSLSGRPATPLAQSMQPMSATTSKPG